MPQRMLPVNWRQWDTQMYRITPKESLIGLLPVYQQKVAITINFRILKPSRNNRNRFLGNEFMSRTKVIGHTVVTSSRRFEEHSFAVTFTRWVFMQLLYWLGVSPGRLGRFYAPSSATRPKLKARVDGILRS